jgi:hypothetical protein
VVSPLFRRAASVLDFAVAWWVLRYAASQRSFIPSLVGISTNMFVTATNSSCRIIVKVCLIRIQLDYLLLIANIGDKICLFGE